MAAHPSYGTPAGESGACQSQAPRSGVGGGGGGGVEWRGVRCIRRTSKRTLRTGREGRVSRWVGRRRWSEGRARGTHSSHSTTCEQRGAKVSTREGSLGAADQVQAPSGAHRALDLEEGQTDARLPVLGRLRKARIAKGEQRRVDGARRWNLACAFGWRASSP